MSASTILFTDVVGFSKKPTVVQRQLIELLSAEVVHELRVLLSPPDTLPEVIALPTGDGMALAFMHGSGCRWNRNTIFNLVLRLHGWAASQTVGDGGVSLRIGVHVGPVELVTDVNGRPNICGDTINRAQRVMDAANPRQTLFSDAAFREYVGQDSLTHDIDLQFTPLKAAFHGPVEVFAKHGLQIVVYKMILEPTPNWYSNDDPVSRDMMVVALTPLPKEIVGTFSDRVACATEIAFVQLTGDRFLASMNEGKITFSPSLKRFWVFMPDVGAYRNLNLTPAHASADFVLKCIGEWKVAMLELTKRYPDADLKLGLFQEPPYFGASYIGWDRPGGVIHVSPYVWGISAPRCPGYDLQWVGRQPAPVYETYVHGLRYLHSHTTNELS